MKRNKLVITLLVLVTGLLTACAGSREVRSVEATKAESLAARPSTVVLDVRTPGEYAEGHLPNAVNIDFYDPAFSKKLDSLDKDKKYLVYCKSGKRSEQATKLMKEKGFTHVANMLGGITAWKGTTVK